MHHRRILSLILALSMALALAGCGRSQGNETLSEDTAPPASPDPVIIDAAPGVDSVFTLRWSADAGFNPYTCTDARNRTILPLLYESLFSVDSSFEASPMLCESYTVSDDGLVWTFVLKSGVKFSDGSALGADDVTASFDAARSSSAYSGRFGCISSVTSSGLSVVITLSRENSRLCSLLDIPVVKSGTAGDAVPVGTGPYVLTSGASPRLAAASYHRDRDALSLDSISLLDCTKEELTADFEQGIIDLFVSDLAGSAGVSFRGNHDIRHFYTSDLYYIGFNCAGGRLFSSADFRGDISEAVDRHELTSEVFGGYLTASPLLFHPSMPAYSDTLAAQYDKGGDDLAAYFSSRLLGDYDRDGFLEYYSGGTIVDFAVDFIVCSEDACKVRAAKNIADKLSAVGYPVTLRELSKDDFLSALSSGDFDMYIAETMLSADFDLTSLLGTGGSLNYGGVSDAMLDAMMTRFMRASEEDSLAAADDLMTQIAKNTWIIPIGFTEKALYTHRGVVTGLQPSQNNVFYGIADWSVTLTAQ